MPKTVVRPGLGAPEGTAGGADDVCGGAPRGMAKCGALSESRTATGSRQPFPVYPPKPPPTNDNQ